MPTPDNVLLKPTPMQRASEICGCHLLLVFADVVHLMLAHAPACDVNASPDAFTTDAIAHAHDFFALTTLNALMLTLDAHTHDFAVAVAVTILPRRDEEVTFLSRGYNYYVSANSAGELASHET
jgi:hypothetical protein